MTHGLISQYHFFVDYDYQNNLLLQIRFLAAWLFHLNYELHNEMKDCVNHFYYVLVHYDFYVSLSYISHLCKHFYFSCWMFKTNNPFFLCVETSVLAPELFFILPDALAMLVSIFLLFAKMFFGFCIGEAFISFSLVLLILLIFSNLFPPLTSHED